MSASDQLSTRSRESRPREKYHGLMLASVVISMGGIVLAMFAFGGQVY